MSIATSFFSLYNLFSVFPNESICTHLLSNNYFFLFSWLVACIKLSGWYQMIGESAFGFIGSKMKLHGYGSYGDFESSNNSGCNKCYVECKCRRKAPFAKSWFHLCHKILFVVALFCVMKNLCSDWVWKLWFDVQHVGSFDFFDWVNPIVKKWKEEIRVQIDWLHKEGNRDCLLFN